MWRPYCKGVFNLLVPITCGDIMEHLARALRTLRHIEDTAIVENGKLKIRFGIRITDQKIASVAESLHLSVSRGENGRVVQAPHGVSISFLTAKGGKDEAIVSSERPDLYPDTRDKAVKFAMNLGVKG